MARRWEEVVARSCGFFVFTVGIVCGIVCGSFVVARFYDFFVFTIGIVRGIVWWTTASGHRMCNFGLRCIKLSLLDLDSTQV